MTDQPLLPGDDLPDDLVELASRYIDGDVDAAERAQVEADPRLAELAARFADLRTQLQRPSAVSAAHSEDAIAAALAAFDSLNSQVPAAPVVRSLDAARAVRQRRMTRWLGAAAAVAALAIGGAALTSTLGSNNDSDDSFSEAQLSVAAGTTAVTEQTLEAADSAAQDDESAASPGADSSAAGAATAAPAEAPTASTAAAAETTTGDAAETTEAAGDTTTTRSAGTVELANEDAVREYLARDETIQPLSSAPCSDQAAGDPSGGPVTYQGRPAVIYVENNTATVYNSETCVVLATVTLT